MNTLPKNKVAGILGAVTAIGGMLLLAAIVVSADPMGRSIGALIGASVLVGLIGTLFGSSIGGRSIRRGPRPGALPQGYPAGPTAVTALPAADTTGWTFDGNDADLAPVVSLTEASIERRHEKGKRREVAAA